MIATQQGSKIFRYDQVSNAGFNLYGLFLEKIPLEPVVTNVLKFDILMPEIDFANTIHGGIRLP